MSQPAVIARIEREAIPYVIECENWTLGFPPTWFILIYPAERRTRKERAGRRKRWLEAAAVGTAARIFDLRSSHKRSIPWPEFCGRISKTPKSGEQSEKDRKKKTTAFLRKELPRRAILAI